MSKYFIFALVFFSSCLLDGADAIYRWKEERYNTDKLAVHGLVLAYCVKNFPPQVLLNHSTANIGAKDISGQWFPVTESIDVFGELAGGTIEGLKDITVYYGKDAFHEDRNILVVSFGKDDQYWKIIHRLAIPKVGDSGPLVYIPDKKH